MDREEAQRLLGTPMSLTPAAPGEPLSLRQPSIPRPSTLPVQPSAPIPAPTPDYPAPMSPEGESKGLLQSLEEGYRRRTEEPGVPLDVETGVSPWERFMLSFRREKENQIKYLQDKYGPENIRTDEQGELIVRVIDADTQKPKDVLVDERKMSAKDLIDVMGVVPEIAGSIVGLRAGRGGNLANIKGFKGVGRDIVSSALGAEAAGAAKDIGVTAYDQPFQDLGERIPKIAKERGQMALTDVAIGGVTYPLWRVFRQIQSPFAGSRKQIQFDALEAQKYFKDRYGVDVPLSAGEATGSGLLTRTEAFTEQLPGSGGPFKELRQRKEGALRELQSIMMGKTPRPDEVVGEAAIRTLRTTGTEPLESGVESARRQLQTGAAAELGGIVSASTMPQRQLYKTTLGKEVRDSVTQLRDAAKAEADRLYGVVRSTPGGTGQVFPTAGLSTDAQAILKSLPTGRRNVPMKDFVPEDIINRLKSLVALKGKNLSLSDLQNMRRDTLDAIPRMEGVPGRGAHYLSEIADSITKAIDSGVASMPGGALKTALEAANKHYREKVVPFNRLGLTELFRRADEVGFVPDSEIVSKIFSGGRAIENYRLLRETLGGASQQVKKLNRAIADDILERSRYPGDEFVDPAKFLRNLGSFQQEYREISDEVFGKTFDPLIKAAKFGQAAGEASLIKPAKISVDELRTLLADKSPNAAKLKALISAQLTRDTAYKNEILRGISAGTTDASAIKPAEFVNRLLDRTSPSEMKTLVRLLQSNPDVLSDVKTKAVEKIFRDAARSATPEDIGRMMSGDPTRIVSGTSVFKQIENPAMREKLKTLLGTEIYNDLREYIRLEAVGESTQAWRTAGALAAGSQISQLLRRGPLRWLGPAAKDWVAAKFLTSDWGRAWLSRGTPIYDPIVLNAVVASPPFLRALTEEFPGEQGRIVAGEIKNSIDTFVQKEGQQAQPQSGSERRSMFQEMLRKGSPTPAPAQ